MLNHKKPGMSGGMQSKFQDPHVEALKNILDAIKSVSHGDSVERLNSMRKPVSPIPKDMSSEMGDEDGDEDNSGLSMPSSMGKTLGMSGGSVDSDSSPDMGSDVSDEDDEEAAKMKMGKPMAKIDMIHATLMKKKPGKIV